jgi:hypothetical protein
LRRSPATSLDLLTVCALTQIKVPVVQRRHDGLHIQADDRLRRS